MDSELLGYYGEITAARFLREHGYFLISAHYNCKFGEIDLIAEDKKYLCFCEVKSRSEGMKYAPSEAVDIKKQRRLILTAGLFLKDYHMDRQPRFDIIEVYFKDDYPYKINHIKNAFSSDLI